ncbi:MAG: hypothetical protein FIA91_04555 [Geobacter sp.]|nr:hypothetical protein [Geobacter sp.]
MKIERLLKSWVMLAACCLSLLPAAELMAAGSDAAADKVVATVKDEPVRASELVAYIEASKLPPIEALTDLIEQKLLRSAAQDNGINVPAGRWSLEERDRIEAALVKALPITVPDHIGELVVDHAYLKTGADDKEQKAGLILMERLRTMVADGAAIPAAFDQLQVDGSNWHIGDHEEYPATVLPDEVRQLPPGGLSSVLAGSDGYNLFKLYDRKIPVDEIRLAVRIYLLEKTGELVNVVEE